MDVALDSALEAFPEEELVRRDQILSLMANFKTALARAKEAETRVRLPRATPSLKISNTGFGWMALQSSQLHSRLG